MFVRGGVAALAVVDVAIVFVVCVGVGVVVVRVSCRIAGGVAVVGVRAFVVFNTVGGVAIVVGVVSGVCFVIGVGVWFLVCVWCV